jgi:uncharacterized membrane protein
MLFLLLGLFVFLGIHSVRIFAPALRERMISRFGENAWKASYSVISIAGFVLMVWGYSLARQTPTFVWIPPIGLRHVAALLTLPAFILVVAAYVPRNHFKSRLGHPMVLGVKFWAFAHLLVNGTLHGMLLFGSILTWAALSFRAARRREPATGAPASVLSTMLTIVVGVVAWAGFAAYLHVRLIGVAPFG